jgi:hypothetical protein
MSSLYSVFVMVAIFGGLAFYYFRIYQKGAAAGGGMMAGFQQHARDRWGTLLQNGEDITTWGMGFLRRPSWQYFLSQNFPILKLVWPMTSYEFVVTSQGRVCMGESGMTGLSKTVAYPLTQVRVSGFAEEEMGLAMKLNPLVPKDHATFSLDLIVQGQAPIALMGVSKDFANALPKG